jgi:hypothetical protein
MEDLLDEDGGTVLIAIDTDPNEDAAAVADAVADRGLSGHFAVSPQMMTDALFEQFGADIVTPPSAPIILIDPAQEMPELMMRGVKSVDDLADAIDALE